jgi:hypothetical protein
MTPIWPPMPGFYAMRLARGGIKVAVRIWYGHAILDGEEQDRSYDWRCEIDGRTDKLIDGERVPLDIDAAWPHCAKHPINEAEYRFLLRRRTWAVEHAPDHPAARPRERIDVRILKPGF